MDRLTTWFYIILLNYVTNQLWNAFRLLRRWEIVFEFKQQSWKIQMLWHTAYYIFHAGAMLLYLWYTICVDKSLFMNYSTVLQCKFKRWISLEKQIRIFELNKSMELINFKKLKLQPFHFCAIRSLVIRIRYWWSASLFVVFMLEKFSGAVDIYM